MPDATQPRRHRATDGVDRIAQAWVRERPGTPVDSIGVITRIWRIGKVLADERQRALSRLGIDAAILDLLGTLRRSGPPYRLAPSELARRSLVSAGAISQRVASAERRGLVVRERSDPDARVRPVALTRAGHALIEASVDELLTHEQSLLSALSPAQQAQLTRLLRLLLHDLTIRYGLEDRPS
jgi:DNA-binding MarR family transcriptional regulator